MKQTKSLVARAALGAGLSIAAASAHAVPIMFDFTGTVTQSFVDAGGFPWFDNALAGQLVSGRIVVETEGLEQFSRTDARGLTLGLGDTSRDSVVHVTSQLIIGGVEREVGAYPYVSGQIEAVDSNGMAPCSPGCSPYSDSMRVLSSSSTLNLSLPPPASYQNRMLYLEWSDPNNALGLVDLANGFDPFNLLPVMSNLLPIGRFYDSTYTYGCTTMCGGIPLQQEGVFFSIDSLTVSAANVPEPETLALFAIGLVGTGLARRTRRR